MLKQSDRHIGLNKPHHHKGRFRNLPNSDISHPNRRTYISFILRMLRYGNEQVVIPDGHVIDQKQAAISLKTHLEATTDSLTWLGQASFLIKMDGKVILTDPYLSGYASPTPFAGPKRIVETGIHVDDLPHIDYLVLSHNHYDHLDSRTLRHLRKRKDMTIIVPLKLGRYFEKRGFANIIEMDWWDSFQAGPVTIRALPSQHWSKRTPFDRNKSLWASYSFEGTNNRIYFTGDTGYAPLFKDIGEEFGPYDYTLVGIGAYEPRAIMKAHHTSPEEAVQIGLDVRSKNVVAMHWGTVRLTDEPLFEPPGRFLQAAQQAGYDEDQSWVMSIGQSRALD
jgi:N-acyl-phosphatidylethanolamine-hydrolysing phospholipase D